ncbi:amidase family protein [Levilactobacillus acidifarinae]|uniref:6-aminohexanoate-cyclic-dimer hydrolase n=1 Tax=Levilactobacillus acidifarinae DSM 19394 = JCM 15949 TaxID=1423715 RepID=A0A0R1LS40_9LACO|nr:amidase family protein [Levilactobacillus acidifarinae]KRK94946.1 6-aminohexanoate-cyclic-dimer hydrolase [Levilactobacillus acidifarinae DSM 19394]GEO70127.1 hypothetical protein LAC03_20370 [Levilactobacillus acidifarinae]
MVTNRRQHSRRRFRSWLLLALTTVTVGMVGGLAVPAHATTTSSNVTAGQLQQAVGSTGTVATPTTTQAGLAAEVYHKSSALDLAQEVRTGKVTSTALVKQAIAKVKADNPQLNGVISLREDAALQEAAALKDTGQPFLGVPILIKGLGQIIKGGQNTQGLLTNKDVISGVTGTLVRNLQTAGFIVIGQTNFPEMGLLNITDSKLYGAAHSAWNTAYQPGGSSGGSATSVADGMVPLATGNDAGGSIRIPASWSGLIGLKPTQGVILGDSSSATAHGVNFAETKTMADTEALFTALKNPKTATTAAPESLKGLTVAYTTKSPVGTPVSADAVRAVQQAVSFLKQQGLQVKEVDPPVDGVALMKDYYLLDTSVGSLSNYLTQFYQKRAMTKDDVSPMNWGLYQASKNVTTERRAAANAEIAAAAEKMATFHQTYPLLLTPTTATTAPLVSDPAVLPADVAKLENMENIPADQQMQVIYDAWLHGLSKTPFTQQANLTGEPAISLPTYVSASGLPLGVQFNAAKGQDPLLMKVGELFEQHHQFKLLQDQSTTTTPTTPSATPAPSQESSATTAPTATQPSVTEPTVVPTMQTKRYAKNIYVTKAFKLYRNVTDLTVKHSYGTHSRATAPHFKVTGIVTLKNGQEFYRVKGGYIRTTVAAHNLYYQRTTKQVKVIAKHGIYEYRHATLKAGQRVKLIKPKTTLKVKKIVFQGHVTRYQLTNGHYITANRQLIQWR